MSFTRSIIAEVSKGACAALLKPLGFRRQAPHFWREQEGVYHAINFQASAWGSKEDGEFTVNLGVTTTVLYEGFTGRKFPSNPGTALWPISRRIGMMMPGNLDHWWKVSAPSDPYVLGEEVATAIRDHAPRSLNIWIVESDWPHLFERQPCPKVCVPPMCRSFWRPLRSRMEILVRRALS